LNALLNAIFVYAFEWGPASIAIATSLSAFVNLGILVFFIKKREKGFYFGCGTMTLRVGVVSALTAFAAVIMGKVLFQESTLWVCLGPSLPQLPRTLSTQLPIFLGQAGLFALFLVIFSRLFGAKEILQLLRFPKREKLKRSS
jgi:putative peptidoglycan lipid II flippase